MRLIFSLAECAAGSISKEGNDVSKITFKSGNFFLVDCATNKRKIKGILVTNGKIVE